MSEHQKRPDRAPTSAAGGARGYKRSWKNLLLNKRYQLVFTLMMVGVSTLLMVGLGWWVMRVATQTTLVGIDLIRPCGEAPKLVDVISANAALNVGSSAPAAAPAAPVADAPVEPAVPAAGSAAAGSAAAGSADAGSADAGSGDAGSADAGNAPGDVDVADDDEEDRPRRSRVVMGETSMEVQAVAPADFVDRIVAHASCELESTGTRKALQEGRGHVFLALLFSGIGLVVGLAIYGIKMTHKVAGPLFKVNLYLNKMRDGRLDKVWNLRKGDQLIEFYEHFKQGHAGLVAMQKAEVDAITRLLAQADAEGWAARSPEAAAAVDELRALLAKKEKSLE